MDISKAGKKFAAFVAAGVMAACLIGPAAAFAVEPSVPDTDGTGGTSTDLNLQYRDAGNRAYNGSTSDAKGNFKVKVPVAINYVVEPNGAITGPSNAMLINYSGYGVHVSDIALTPENTIEFVASGNERIDKVSLTLAPKNSGESGASGTQISLHNFDVTKTEDNTDAARANLLKGSEWNIAAADTSNQDAENTVDGVSNILRLVSLSGKSAGFQAADYTSSMQKIGTIAWTIVPGWKTGL